MIDLTDEQLTTIVRQARCRRCDGNGFRLVPAEDERGERTGETDKIDCADCAGYGIHLQQCRRLAAEVGGGKRPEAPKEAKGEAMGQKSTPVKPGTRWGRLSVLRPILKNEHSHVLWEVRCDCGIKIRVWGYNLVKKTGNVTSCGCAPRGEAGNIVNERSK